MTTDPSHPSGSPLRQRMIEDMTMRGFTEETRRDYIRCVKTLRGLPRPLARHGDGRGPAPVPGAADAGRRAAADHQQLGVGAALLLHRDARPARPGAPARPSCRHPRKLPVVLSPEEVARLLEAAPGPQVPGRARHRLWRGPARRPRSSALKVADIDSERMLIRVEQGKGAQGSQRHALAAAARAAARLVAGGQAARA